MGGMPTWRAILLLTAFAVLLVPGVAAARPPAPEPAAPALTRTPYLVRANARRVSLHLRLDRRLVRRFDGELLARVTVDGHYASLAAVPARRGGHGACYSASLAPGRVELGRVYTVVLLVDGAEPVTTLVELRAPRPGDARGARLGC
jgi:hypothetical protein